MFDTADVKSCHTVCNPICKHSFYFLKIQFFQFAPLLNETAKRWKNDLPDCKSKLSSSVVLSAPTILWPRVRIPSTPSMLFSICIEIVMRKRTKINKKRPGLSHFFKKNLITFNILHFCNTCCTNINFKKRFKLIHLLFSI